MVGEGNERQQKISAPRLAMMALGTVIGGSFFLGSTVALKAAGPGIVVSYLLGGLLYITICLIKRKAGANK